jgi:hypothetical protein
MGKVLMICAALIGFSTVAMAEGRQRCMGDCEIASRPINCKAKPAECAKQRKACEATCPKK